MKRITIFLGILSSVSVMAEEAKIEITSFVMAGYRTHAAELCGKVTGATAPFVVAKIAVDPNAEKPGIYNVLVGAEGKFCTTVVTYDGIAQASVVLLNQELQSALTNVSTKNFSTR